MIKKTKRIKGVQCGACGDRIFSWSVHDFRECSCKKTFVDGGREYLRYGGTDDFEPGYMPKIIYFSKKDSK